MRWGYRLMALVGVWAGGAQNSTSEQQLIGMALIASAFTLRPLRSRVRWQSAVFIVAVALVIGYQISKKLWTLKLGRTAELATTAMTVNIDEHSVAVSPFVDMSEKKDQQYFSEGLSEELINLLSKVSALRVPARTSSFYFKDKSEDIPTIARRLMVANVLEGSVRKAGDHVRITVQLVRADNGYHLWSQTYDRKLDDIFKVQDDIASAVVGALKVSILGAEAPRASRPQALRRTRSICRRGRCTGTVAPTPIMSVHLLYLRKALKLDPGFARGWAALAMFRCGDQGSLITVSTRRGA